MSSRVDVPVPWPDDAVEVGRIGGAWGVKGWFKVQPFATDAQALFSARRWFLRPAEDSIVRPDLASTAHRVLNIVEIKEHAAGLVACGQGVADRTQAQAIYGARVHVARSHFPKPAIDEYYWVDLIGLTVTNRDGANLGSVVGLIDTGPHSVLRVVPRDASDAAAERLIPFVSAYIDDVSLDQRRIGVDWGLDF
ncbi:MAG: ribosome maturation factor RimM [Burkholderiaceae bacterium]